MDDVALRKSHDLNSLPQWGPYTKRYAGTSHISDPEQGVRFDLSIFPGIYRRKVELPNVLFEGDYYPWMANPDLHFFQYRHSLEWKDRLYTDIGYYLIQANTQAIQVNIVNNTPELQSLCLHFLASLDFPSLKEYEPDNILFPCQVSLAENAYWINSNSYITYRTRQMKPTDNLVADGKNKNEVILHNFVKGSAILFGESMGDELSYNVNNHSTITNGQICLRYLTASPCYLEITINDTRHKIKLETSLIPTTIMINAPINLGLNLVKLTALSSNLIYLDGFAYGSSLAISQIKFKQTSWDYTPSIKHTQNGIILSYANTSSVYGIKWFASDPQIRAFISDHLDQFFKQNANDHVKQQYIDGNSNKNFTNLFFRPINIKAQSNLTVYALVCSGESIGEVEQILTQYEQEASVASCITKFKTQNSPILYPLSQQLINATLLTNIVYPIYTQGQYIRHSTPGKWWDCLYTWDSGFIGLGLLELNEERAIENLRAYLTELNNESKFIHHGSPVPTQFYLAFEVWNKTQDNEFIKSIYPELKQYYEFLAGYLGSSSTNKFGLNILQTWDYFYNSGGWDDYPAQKYLHDKGIVSNYCPVITTSNVIRMAKMLCIWASNLNYLPDIAQFKNDIQIFSNSLNNYAWDEDSKYYAYTEHNSKNIIGILRYHNINFNMGMDGVYPLIAGICSASQEQSLIEHLQSPNEMWVENIGITVVSQAAPYYLNDGYWNGTVWMAHQWVVWKTMLDLGQVEFATKIAQTALTIWDKESNLSYRSLEHFVNETGRGAGWSSFSGLSCPVINWYHAYNSFARVNVGFDCQIMAVKFNSSFNSGIIKLKTYTNHKSAILICLPYLAKRHTITINENHSTATQALGNSFYLLIDAIVEKEFTISINLE